MRDLRRPGPTHEPRWQPWRVAEDCRPRLRAETGLSAGESTVTGGAPKSRSASIRCQKALEHE